MSRHALTIVLLSLLVLLSPPAGAEDAPQGALYLGPGRMLEASQPRQLSLNAHVGQFLYQPGGLSIAYLSAVPDGDGYTQSIRLVGLKRGETTTLLTRGPADRPAFTSFIMSGWTADGRYLVVTTDLALPSVDGPETHLRPAIYCLDVGTTPVQIRPLALSLPPPSKDVPYADANLWWAPSRTRLLIEQSAGDRRVKSDERVHLCAIYDPARDRSETFPLPPGEFVRGWTDESHLLLLSRTGNAAHFFSWNVATGTQSETTQPAKMPERYPTDSSDVSPKSPALTLDVEQRFHPDRLGVTGIDSHLLWVRRTGQPQVLSALPVGLTPGGDDPLAVWSPTGKQIAFLEHGDLYVTDLSERDARPQEKSLAGEKLSCLQEREVAAANLKQIGLGIMQYAQENDEKFPAANGVKGLISPYIRNDAVFGIGGHPFVYHAPSDLSLAAMESLAGTILGTIDLPCGRVALYADGHVKNLPLPGPGR